MTATQAGAVYLAITNRGDDADRLLGANTPAARRAILHRTVLEGGIARMAPAGAVDVPAGGTMILRPGGIHFMLMGLAAPLEENRAIPLVLHFERAGEVLVEVQILATGTSPLSPAPSGPGGEERRDP